MACCCMVEATLKMRAMQRGYKKNAHSNKISVILVFIQFLNLYLHEIKNHRFLCNDRNFYLFFLGLLAFLIKSSQVYY